MNKVFAVYRYFVFALFIACNIGILVVAAKDISLSFTSSDGSTVEVDALLIALGSVGLVFTLPVLLVDALRKETVVRHVWFECFWVGLFCLLQLSSAGVVTLTMSGMGECALYQKNGVTVIGSCDYSTSTLLMAFTWAAAADLLLYLLTVTVIAILHQQDDPLVWKAYVSQYSWFAVRHSLGSEPPTPSLPVQSVPKSGQSEFSNRMVAPRRDTDPEKQAPASLQVPPQTSLPRRPSLEKSQRSPTWTPRQLQLSASVPLSPKTAKAIHSRRVESPAGAPVNRTYVPATRPRESTKKVLRLHRPPSLDLSRITPPR